MYTSFTSQPMNREGFVALQQTLSNMGGFHILLFDSNKLDRAHTKFIVKQAHYAVIATGEQSFALNMLANNAELIDLIMIDDKPQATDCATFIEMIKEITQTIPIILLSSWEIFLSATLIQTGVCLTIKKPISVEGVMSLQRYLKHGWNNETGGSANALLFCNNGNDNKRRLSDEGSSFVPDKRGKGIMLNAEKNNNRRRCKAYTNDLHMKYIQLLDKTKQVPKQQSLSISKSPSMPSSSNTCQFKNKEVMDISKSNSNAYIHQGFPIYGGNALTALNNTTPLILNSNPWVLSSNFGSSSQQIYNYNNNNFGGKRKMNNDLSKFTKLIENQNSILSAVHGEYAKKFQHSGLQIQASPFNPPTPPIETDICLSTIDFNEEENTLVGIKFAPLNTTNEQAETTKLDFESAVGFGSSNMQMSNVTTTEEDLDTEIWLHQIMIEKDGNNPTVEDHSNEDLDVADIVVEGDTELHDMASEFHDLLNN